MGIITPVVRSTPFLLLFFEILLSFFKAPVLETKAFPDAHIIGPQTSPNFIDSGNSNFFSVFALNEVSPITVITQDITVYLDASGNVSIAEDAVNKGSTSTNGLVSFDTNTTSFNCSDVGSNTVTLTVTDGTGNTATGKATVTVEDNFGPTVITQNITVQLNASGIASITAAEINSSTDNCGIDSFTLNQTKFDCNNIGANTITLTVTDVNGNTATGTATITVEDKIAPTVITNNITVHLDESGHASITKEQINNGSFDNCAIADLELDRISFTCSDIGEKTVTLTVTDVNGNVNSGTATVTVEDKVAPVAPVIADVVSACTYTATAPTATDTCRGTITGTTSDSLTYSNPGTHTITWKFDDGHGNISTANQIIVIDPIVPTAQITHITCYGSSTGSVSVAATGGNEPYTYSWDTLTAGANKTGMSAGIYNVTVTDATGCTSDLKVEITQPDQISMEPPILSHVSCHGENDGKITINNTSGGIGKHVYSLNGSAFTTNKVYQNLTQGEYTIRIRDEKNCIVSETITITEPDELSMTEPTATSITCFGGNDGSITAGIVSGGTAPYQYSIDNTNFQSSGNFTGIAAGRVSVFVVDVNGCAVERSIVVEQPDILAASIKKKDVSCHEGSDGEIYLDNISGGSGSYKFSIDGITWNSSADAITSLAAGDYLVRIMDSANEECIVEIGDIILNEPAPLTVPYSTTRTTTFGSASGSATANPTGGSGIYSYEWNKVGDAAIIQTTKTANNLLAGEYIVTVTDSNGCSLSSEVIKVVDKVTAEINAISLCEDVTGEGLRTSTFSVDLPTVMGGFGDPEDFTYNWTFGSGIESVTETPEGYKVEYEIGGDKIITLTITETSGYITILQFPHYVGQCFENCGQSSNFIIDTESFYIGDEAGNPISGDNCSSTAKKYLWFNILENSNAYALNTEIKYSVNDGNETHKRVVMGCSGTKVEKPKENGGGTKWEYELLPIGKYRLFEVSDIPTSNNSMIEWSCGQSFTIEGLTMRFVTNAGKECGDTGNMQCIGVTDNQEVSTPIIASATTEAVTCKNEALGSITFSVKGGIPPYNYSINGNVDSEYKTSGIFVNLFAGSYDNLWVKDSRGNTYQLPDPVVIEEPLLALDAITEIVSPILCNGGTAGAKVTATGGTAPYTYLWNDSSETTSDVISEVLAGTYTVTVIDANGCQVIKSLNITEPAPLTTAEVGEPQHLGCGFNSTFLEANTPSEGIGKWSVTSFTPDSIEMEKIDFEVNNPNTRFSAPKGTYTLRWTIANEDGSCANFAEVTVQFDGNCEQLDFDGIDDYIFVGDSYDFPSTSFSLEAWVKPEAVNGNRTVLSKGNWRNPGAGGYELLINNGAPTFRWNNNSVTTSHKIDTNRWYHLAVIFTRERVELFVDGIPVGNRTVSSAPTDVAEPFLIGGMYDSSDPENPQSLFHGWIEEVRIWETALTLHQVRFMMNQRIEEGTNSSNGILIKGEMIPMNVPGSLLWSDLIGYYRLLAQTELIENGTTPNLASDQREGYLKNIKSFQVNSAPLPYISEAPGPWNSRSTWDQAIGTDAEKWWEYPNSTGIDGTSINWNIAFVNDVLTSGNRDITLLALVIGGSLEMEGINPVWAANALTPGTGNGLKITHYLELNGLIDLDGESQLVQPEGSVLAGSGTLEKDQQGTASSYNYNYWTSPVSTDTILNSGYTIQSVLRDGTDPETDKTINFNYQYHYADGAMAVPIRISTYWMNKFSGDYGKYSQWRYVGPTGALQAGEGFSMKGSSGYSPIKELQNYTFKGFPNNGTINLPIAEDQSYLIGNPYPSAIDANQFILDNIRDSGGNNSNNVFNGTLYFWDHFSGKTHYLQEYVGGYATYNLSGGVRAIANDSRINNETTNGEYKTGDKIPQQYIPVGQAFFVNSILDDAIKSSEIPVTVDGGNIVFRNSQRIFMKENSQTSVFHSQEPVQKKEKEDVDKRKKIWLKFESPTGYHRQLLVTADTNASNGYDIGYDAILTENNAEDMYWYFSNVSFVIQGVSHFNKDQVLPLGMKIKKDTDFIIRIDDLENVPDEMEIYLKDKHLKVLHDLRSSDYKATAQPGSINDRFELVFQGEDPDQSEPGEGGEDSGGEDGGNEDGGGDQGGDGGGESPDPDSGGIVPPTGLEIFYVQETREIIIRNPGLLQLSNAFLNNTLGQQVIEYPNIPDIEETSLPVRDFGTGVYVLTLNSQMGPIIRKIMVE